MTRAHQLSPNEPVVYRELFQLCLVDENHPGAIRAARELAALEPASAEPLYLEGLALLLSSDATGAEQKLRAAIARDPKFWQAKQALAKLEVMRGQKDAAQMLLEAVLAEQPTEPGPANDLATLYFAGAAPGARVEKLLRPVMAEHPTDPTTAYNLAVALQGRAQAEAKQLAQLAASSRAPCAAAAKRLLATLGG
jgi:predicted Zn-dependent protease